MEPFLLAVGGLVASGKSTLARALADGLGATRLEADAVRDVLLEGSPASRRLSPHLADEVYLGLLEEAENLLRGGRSVVLDACFPRVGQRREARALARLHAARFLFVECRAEEETLRARIAERERRRGWKAIAADLAARYERPVGLAAPEVTEVWSERPIADLVASVEKALAGEAQRAPTPEAPPARRRALEPPAAVTFDCWNTLLVEDDWKSAHALRVEAVADAAREAGREVSREDAGAAFDAAWERHMRIWRGGTASGAPEIAVWALAELGLRTPEPALAHLVTRFQEASHSSGVRSLEGARETLAALGERGVPCGLVCDTGLTPGRVVRRHLERLGLLEHLAALAFSDEVGVPKPHPRAFRTALEPLGVSWEASWHVGDLLRTDVAGARALGMISVRIRDTHDDDGEEPEADVVVASHAELLSVLLAPDSLRNPLNS